ncbi:MAG TPA: RidA family protein [Sulfurovum sp.]|nr:MAG: deaminase [Sulfurovum sp. 35-42-20]OYZ24152.1 MAG: deaminase [Sulfurovum sp. 16-42-52]OYZ47911.1 MAG: deaminase [Sulfurovum sp. 24-42-9]OZA43992.1 MAG: deaminase [Sulfurovum sp. 17-42-90]OZA61462.1 MAG: deaminase [Sulfurovum sp. 39-42-12]HQR74682.1 RidA family protein [Sulfurovum sp.]
MKFITTQEAPQAIGPYSQAVKVNGFIYTSGQIGLTPEGVMAGDDVENQTHQVMKNLFYVLEAAGAHFNDVIKTTIFLADMSDFEKVNAIYAHYFGMHKPVRSTVAVKTLPKNALVEIDCIALDGIEYSF